MTQKHLKLRSSEGLPRRRTVIVLIHLSQLGLIIALCQAQTYYANHLGFMRNVSFYTKKIVAGSIGLMIDYLALLVLVSLLAMTLWQKTLIGKRTVSWGIVLILTVGFGCWQWLVPPTTIAIYYFVSTSFFLAILGQLGVFYLATKDSKK